LHRSFFCASGSEANEGAMMLATLATGRREFVSLDGALHGRTKAAINANGLEMWRTDPFPLANFHRVPGPHHPDSLEDLRWLLRKGSVAAVIAEPVQGNGGIVVPPADYWPELRKLCTAFGTLLIADEVQTAWNRTGRWFATSHWNVVPDIVTVAKALGNGLPIAAYLTTDELAAKYTRPGAATFGGNLVCCRAALATLRFHQEHRLGERSTKLGDHLRARLRSIQHRRGVIADVRGLGLMVAAELDAGAESAAVTDAVLEWMKDAGYLLGKCGPGRNVLAFLPPLVVEQSDLDRMVNDLDRILASVG
jgi:4-aminobutyrate aminotransferase-like enzyme